MRGAQSKTGTCRIFLRGHIELQSVPCTQHVVRKLTVNFKKLTFLLLLLQERHLGEDHLLLQRRHHREPVHADELLREVRVRGGEVRHEGAGRGHASV